MFQSPDEDLADLLKEVHSGKLQLPDFQRDWKWDDDHIVSLLASVSLGYPVGAMMVLEIGGNAQFVHRLVAGVPAHESIAAERLILDGQQRLTSLYQSLYSGSAAQTKDSKGKRLVRWYYIDIDEALREGGDREEAIVAVNDERMKVGFRKEIQLDISSRDKECDENMLPLSLIFDPMALNAWQTAWLQRNPDNWQDRLQRWNQLMERAINNFLTYKVPVIELRKSTPRDAVCIVFEKVNSQGVPLNVFELLTATYAASGFRLKEDWDARRTRMVEKTRVGEASVLSGLASTDYLQAVTLLATRARRLQRLAEGDVGEERLPAIGCKRGEVLKLPLTDYSAFADDVERGFLAAAKLLVDQHVFRAANVPYGSQLVPLAAVLAVLGAKAEPDAAKAKLRRWFWCGVLGELYGGSVESRFAFDLPEVEAWITNAAPTEPRTVADAVFYPARLLTLTSRRSAAYKGIYALLMEDGANDFRTGDTIDSATFFDEAIDIHHVFPKKWCSENGVDYLRQESIINKTALSARTNRIIGGNPPSVYLAKLQADIEAPMTTARLDEFLSRHAIAPHHLRADDFAGYFADRAEALLQRIERRMGKPVIRETDSAEEPENYEAQVVQNGG